MQDVYDGIHIMNLLKTVSVLQGAQHTEHEDHALWVQPFSLVSSDRSGIDNH
jgi:hypothetical protein